MRKQHRRILGYARVSSAEQAIGTSLQDQQDAVRAEGKVRGLVVARLYVEAESAIAENSEKREQINSLLRDVRDGDLVVCAKIDRWSRDPEFTYRSIRQILEVGADFYAIDDRCDPSTNEGDTMLNFRILFAKEEYKRIKQRMVGTRQALQNKGLYIYGKIPPGYRRADVKGAEKNVLVIHEEEAAEVRAIFRMCIDGKSFTEISDELGVSRGRVNIVLHNRHYLGELREAPGEKLAPGKRGTVWINGRHPAIIDPHTWMSAQKEMARRRMTDRPARYGSGTTTWWLRDVARCGLCDAKMIAAYSERNASGNRRYYFKCYARCTSRYIRVERAEAQCEPYVVERLDELRESLIDSMKSTAKQEPKASGESLEAKRARLARKRERYVEAYSDGAMDREALRQAMTKLDAERMKLDAESFAPPPVTKERTKEVLRLVGQIEAAWRKAKPEAKRRLVNGLARSVAIVEGAEPRFAWYSVEELLRRGGAS